MLEAGSQAPFQVDASLIDLEFGFQGFELLFDHFDDGLGRCLIAVGQGQFHGCVGWMTDRPWLLNKGLHNT